MSKIRNKPNKSKGASTLETSTLGVTNPMVQELENELLALKKKVSQDTFLAPYKYIPRKTYLNNARNYVANNRAKLPPPPERLSLEAPSSNSIVGYFETHQSDLLPIEEDVATPFKDLGGEEVGGSNIGYLHFKEFFEGVDANINVVLTCSQS